MNSNLEIINELYILFDNIINLKDKKSLSLILNTPIEDIEYVIYHNKKVKEEIIKTYIKNDEKFNIILKNLLIELYIKYTIHFLLILKNDNEKDKYEEIFDMISNMFDNIKEVLDIKYKERWNT